MAKIRNLPTLDSLNHRNIALSHESGVIEREKARRRLDRMAKAKQRTKQVQEELKMKTHTVQHTEAKKRTRPGIVMEPPLRAPLIEHIYRVGEKEASEDIENLEPSRSGSSSARDAIRHLLQKPEHRWATRSIRMWTRLLACWSRGMRPHELRREGIDLTLNGEVVTVLGETVREDRQTQTTVVQSEPEPSMPESTALMSYQVNAEGLPVMVMDGVTIRVAGTPDRPLFCAADVCRALDIANSRSACESLAQDELELVSVQSTSGSKQATFVTEPGLYKLIQKSRKPLAKEFDRWVRHEVLPSIRKTGTYSTGAPVVAGQDASLAASMATAFAAAMTPMVSMMLESQERVMRMVLSGGMGSVGAPVEAKRFSDLPEDQKAAIIANMVRRFADQLAYEGVPHHYPVAWNSLYAQYEADTGDPVRERANSESDSSDVRVRPFDLLKREQKLDQLMAAARKALVKKP